MWPGGSDFLPASKMISKALAELDDHLREMQIEDPVKYDFALFGLGAFEGY